MSKQGAEEQTGATDKDPETDRQGGADKSKSSPKRKKKKKDDDS